MATTKVTVTVDEVVWAAARSAAAAKGESASAYAARAIAAAATRDGSDRLRAWLAGDPDAQTEYDGAHDFVRAAGAVVWSESATT